jgi:hypothetical protein
MVWPKRFPRSLCPLTLCALALILSGSLQAADVPNNPPGPEPLIQAPDSPPQSPEDKRIFGVIPNYRTAEDTGVYTPITSHQKLVIATKDTLDYPLFLLGGAFAALAQVTDQHPDFGQGLKGYGHRYATAYSDQFTATYLLEGFLPILFHEDPRYFRRGSGHGSIWSRSVYSATRIFVTKTDRGASTFNFAEVLGDGISAGVGNAYYPKERHASDNLHRLAVSLSTDAISQVLKEFWPDVREKYFKRRHRV